MSDPAKPSDPDPVDPGPSAPPSNPSASPLEIVPEATRLQPVTPSPTVTPPPAGTTPDPGQALVVVPPATLVPSPADGSQPAGSTPGGPPPPPRPPIDYAMPAPKKGWLPSPAMIKNLGCIFKMLFGFTVLLILGYVMLMALNPKAREWALQGQPGHPSSGSSFPLGGGGKGATGGGGGGGGPTPFKAMNSILAIPAQALAKTDDVVKANNARAGVVDGMVAEEEQKAKGGTAARAVVNPFANQGGTAEAGAKGAKGAAKGGGKEGEVDPAEAERAALAARMMALAEQGAHGGNGPKADAVRPTAVATKQTDILPPVTLPGGILIQNASPEGAPPAARPFFYWIVNASISGISPGPPPRLLVGGRLTYEGNEVHIPLGIVFERLDPAKKLLYFRDATGAVVTRSY